ncbi:type II toxin-antitoxin system RelE/ParE family toxin [Candidatus Thiothrix anitrata]|jgi:toxin ParE1/3/4|uniref:Toxin n=1 Tax=Candidatus Thiothrix anitrata TaxID=2823902 RepID=A0ABX7X3G7_9GAMM|nr:type II toxin-antitoxin system RelE/ParE family toxin [Candidatus Thiothrix anitrata]QTR50437.1 type II toxin-antitoxin system RelE/ParE family toxin [Candidatus Thiothrix anitrata]
MAHSLSPLAVEDLKGIWRYGTATWGLTKAEQYGEKLLDAFDFLAENPNAGQPINHIRTGYKRYPVGAHLIFYRLGLSSSVEIIRILHQSMDSEQHLQDK